MKVCEDVAEYKIHTGKQVLDPKREQDKLDVLKNQAHGSFNSLGAQELFQQIMAISRKRQYQLLTKNGVGTERNYKMVDELPLKDVTLFFRELRRIQLCGHESIFPGGDQQLPCQDLPCSDGGGCFWQG